MLLVSPSSWETLTDKAVPGTAGTHPHSQMLWLDSIKAFTASDMTASDLQWQLIKRNYTPLLWKAATQNSFRDYTFLNKRKTLGFNKTHKENSLSSLITRNTLLFIFFPPLPSSSLSLPFPQPRKAGIYSSLASTQPRLSARRTVCTPPSSTLIHAASPPKLTFLCTLLGPNTPKSTGRNKVEGEKGDKARTVELGCK